MNKILAYWHIFLLATLISCGNTDPYVQPAPGPDPGSGEPGIEVEITNPAITRATNVVGESTFENLWVIVIDDAGNVEYCRDILHQYDGDIDIGDLRRISRVLTGDIQPGPKEFYAIGNAPDRWIDDYLEDAEKDNIPFDPDNFFWMEEDLPVLLKNNNDEYIKIKVGEEDKFQIDPNKLMRFSGYTRETIKPESANYVTIPVTRIAGKLEVELVPTWKTHPDNEYTGNEIDLSKTGATSVAVTVRNRAKESPLLPTSRLVDIADWNPAIPIDQVYGQAAPEYPDPNGERKVAYEITTEGSESPRKTVKTVPAYFLENHPAFDDSAPPGKWNAYDRDRHPLIKIAINADGGQGGTRDDLEFRGVLPEKVDGEEITVEGIFRNHHYHLTVGVWIDPSGLFMSLSVLGWTQVEEGGTPTPPIEIPN